MKILIINAQAIGGGTEVQCLREKKILEEHGHKVWYITFTDVMPSGFNVTNHINIKYGLHSFSRLYYRNNIYTKFFYKLKSIIDGINPDVIHINNLQDNAYTVLEACKNYKVLKTIRDPGLICPKSTCLRRDLHICPGRISGNCIKCIGIKVNFQFLNFQFNSIVRKYSNTVSKFICPSEYLSACCTNNGLETECVNNPFDFSIVKKDTITNSRMYLYYGYISEEKGVKNLLDAFKRFNSKYPLAKLLLAGKLGNISLDYIKSYASYNVEYIGVLQQKDIMDLYKKIYCVVVPSIWLENYPNTVLEALACKTLVIGANRGGITNMINNRNLLFNPLDIQDIEKVLVYTNNLAQNEYTDIVINNNNRVLQTNNTELFYEKIIKILGNI